MTVRALIDSAAESSFITQHVAQCLHLQGRAVNVAVAGVGGALAQVATREVQFTLLSKVEPHFSSPVTALVLKKLTAMLPTAEVAKRSWSHLQGIALADPHFTTPGRIDAILAADVYAAIYQPKVKRGAPNEPIAIGSTLGWLVMGPAGKSKAPSRTSAFHTSTSNSDLSQALQRFWEVEEMPKNFILSPGDKYCEEHFSSTVKQLSDGRFSLRLPFCKQPDFPRSRDIALACFHRLERRFDRQPALASDYKNFMKAYIELGHMEPVPQSKLLQPGYYIPHHAVYKNEKIRVVFNASQKAGSGISLNDCLYPGPKTQEDLPIILIRWRFFKNVFVADIVKMYRQFRLHQDDVNYQRILWHFHPDDPIAEFQLLTVTYGTTSAQYLAIKALLYLAKKHAASYPQAAKVLQDLCYIDHIFAGADDDVILAEVKAELVKLLSLAKLELGKWSSNSPTCLPEACSSNCFVPINLEDCRSTLGINWLPADDNFIIKVSSPEQDGSVTKRTVSSVIAKLYDPLGLLAPVIIRAKPMLPTLWIKGFDWDQKIDETLLDTWQKTHHDL